MYLIAFPLLLIPFVLYCMVAFLLDMDFTTKLFDVPLLAGRSMAVSTGDLLVLLGIVLLYVEILKATRMSSKAIMDHVLSLALFVGMVVEFMLVPQAATPTFFLLTVLAFVDVITGVSVSARPRRSEIVLEGADEARG